MTLPPLPSSGRSDRELQAATRFGRKLISITVQTDWSWMSHLPMTTLSLFFTQPPWRPSGSSGESAANILT
jgi:hypothetical protein